MKANSINGNKKDPSAMLRSLMSVDTDFDRTVPIRKILSYLIVQTQIISKTLSTAVESTVSHLALIVATNKKQFIVSVIRGLTPRTGRQTYWNRVWIMGQPSTYHWLITMYGKGGRTK